VMVIALISGGLYLCNRFFGGVPGLFRELMTKSPAHLTTPGPSGFWTRQNWINWMAFGIGIATQPQIFQKFFTVKDEKSLRASLYMHPILTFTIYTGAMLMGLIAVLLIPGLTAKQADMATMMLIGKYIPVGLGGVMAVGIVAAAMSTADSQYITLSSLFIRDIYEKWLCPRLNIKPKMERLVLLGRLFSIVLLVIGFGIAYLRLTTLVDMLTLTVYPLGTQIYIPMIFGLYWRKTTNAGAISGLLAGMVTSVLTLFVVKSPLGMHPLFWGAAVNIFVLVAVSMFTQKPAESVIERIHDYVDECVYGAGSR